MLQNTLFVNSRQNFTSIQIFLLKSTFFCENVSTVQIRSSEGLELWIIESIRKNKVFFLFSDKFELCDPILVIRILITDCQLNYKMHDHFSTFTFFSPNN